MSKTVIEAVMWECPICGQQHAVDRILRDASCKINGLPVTYQETVYRCTANSDNPVYFYPGDVFDDNLEQARQIYISKHSCSTPNYMPQMYGKIPFQLIPGDYAGKKAKRFSINGSEHSVWIPNKHLTEDGSLLPNQNIDYIFNSPENQNKCRLAGLNLN